jgi:hypothetical protein
LRRTEIAGADLDGPFVDIHGPDLDRYPGCFEQ